MDLAVHEVEAIKKLGLFIRHKCDQCQKPLNQILRYTIAGRDGVYCSSECRDLVFFGNQREAAKRSHPGRCGYCRESLTGKNRSALYCSPKCRMRANRMREAEKSRTAAVPIQQVTASENAGQGNRPNPP